MIKQWLDVLAGSRSKPVRVVKIDELEYAKWVAKGAQPSNEMPPDKLFPNAMSHLQSLIHDGQRTKGLFAASTRRSTGHRQRGESHDTVLLSLGFVNEGGGAERTLGLTSGQSSHGAPFMPADDGFFEHDCVGPELFCFLDE
jgi:hypothetical protein